MNTKIQKVIALFLAILMLVFGLNKFIGFIPIEPPSDPTAQKFLGTMFTTYLFKVVAAFEIVAGVLLVIPKTKFLGWLVLLPIIFNIVAFHFAHDFIGNGIWLLPSFLFLLLGYFNKEDIVSLLK